MDLHRREHRRSNTVPGFVYGIVIAQFIFFFSFGLNQWLQYREVGRWTDYARRRPAVLSLVAKSMLAWRSSPALLPTERDGRRSRRAASATSLRSRGTRACVPPRSGIAGYLRETSQREWLLDGLDLQSARLEW
jgi:hypothetical protein